MRLVLQLDLATLPEDPAVGLLQIFQGGGTQLARIVAADAAPIADEGPAWNGRAIVGFSKAKADFPSVAHDPARTEGTLDDDQRATLRDLHLGGDKVGGWPDWLQDPVYPAHEGRTFDRLLVQLVGGRLVPADFGDAGHAYVFADPNDPSKVALVTQSY